MSRVFTALRWDVVLQARNGFYWGGFTDIVGATLALIGALRVTPELRNRGATAAKTVPRLSL